MDILWICADHKALLKAKESLGHPENVRFITPGMAIAGYGADLIVLDNWEPGKHTKGLQASYEVDWYRSSVKCRLMGPNRRIVKVEDYDR